MNTHFTAGTPLSAGLTLALILCFAARTGIAQVPASAFFEAPLVARTNDTSTTKGTAQATLVEDKLHFFVAFHGLGTTTSNVVGAHLYRGDPDDGGEHVLNIGALFGATGGFESVQTLTPSMVEDLEAGKLFVQIRSEFASPAQSVTGALTAQAAPHYLQARMSHIYQGWPVARGAIRALMTAEGIRLVGYANSLGSDWQRISLYEARPGEEKQHITSIYGLGFGNVYLALDHTLQLPDGDWQDAFNNGRVLIAVETSRPTDALSGRLLSANNQPPNPSIVKAPYDGEVIMIGGLTAEDSVPPDVYLGTVVLETVDDPDGDDVSYIWQLSLRPGFGADQYMTTIELGVDSTTVRLSVARAAALFDLLASGEPGGISFQTPVTVYHRVLTTDGSHYSVGPTTTTTFIRGTVTSKDETPGIPGLLVVDGNYPNPFSDRTRISFSLPQAANVRIDVFDLLGQEVASVSAGYLSAGELKSVEIDGSHLAAGTYVYRIAAIGPNTMSVASGRMIRTR